MGYSMSAQSPGLANAPENDDESSDRDLISRKRSQDTEEVPSEKPAFSLTDDLPAEIRLNIYRHLFDVPGEFFELLCPEYRATYLSSTMNSYRVLAIQVRGLRMMRVCKKIRGEVAEYFYGSHNFRFSQRSCMAVMSCFFHTIGNSNCNSLKHLTLQLPRAWHDNSGWFNGEWDDICREVSRRGMRKPDYKYQPRYKSDVRLWSVYCYDEAVHGVFHQLRGMPNLKKLELAIPTKYNLFDFRPWHPYYGSDCSCRDVNFETMSPEDRTRHMFQDHTSYGKYLDLLADLKENAASESLTIALAIHYSKTAGCWIPDGRAQRSYERNYSRTEGSWIAAYAAIMGYELGYARWERNDEGYHTYRVSYDKDPMLSDEANPFIESSNDL